MKIEFGCGAKLRRGYIGCDVRALSGVEYVCPCWEIHNHVQSNSVEEIYSRHMFEHLTFKQGENSLKSWFKILKSGGVVNMILPNLHFHVEEYLRNFYDREGGNVRDSYEHSIAGFYGWQKETEDSPPWTADKNDWGTHKSGYDIASLNKLVEKCGYDNFEARTDKPHDLNVIFQKP
jgi:predicted SAM-dependent methyltransferase|tara:strand:+ start:2293 stop:2823 length:531 start_codon:yes stop_codon:yes gene_type:complete